MLATITLCIYIYDYEPLPVSFGTVMISNRTANQPCFSTRCEDSRSSFESKGSSLWMKTDTAWTGKAIAPHGSLRRILCGHRIDVDHLYFKEGYTRCTSILGQLYENKYGYTCIRQTEAGNMYNTGENTWQARMAHERIALEMQTIRAQWIKKW
jgi:hypothetical protein